MKQCVVVKTDGCTQILPDVTPNLEAGKLVLYCNKQKEVIAAFAKGEWANFYMRDEEI